MFEKGGKYNSCFVRFKLQATTTNIQNLENINLNSFFRSDLIQNYSIRLESQGKKIKYEGIFLSII